MGDCSNVELRELLPEFVSGAASLADRRRVELHVATCDACAAEMQLLVAARAHWMRQPTPALDYAAIGAAAARARQPRRAPQSVSSWRMAAALSVVTLGALSIPGVQRFYREQGAPPVVAESVSAVAGGGLVPSALPPARTSGGLGAGGGTSDLADEDLQALIDELEQLDAAVSADVERHPGDRLVGSGIGG